MHIYNIKVKRVVVSYLISIVFIIIFMFVFLVLWYVGSMYVIF